MNILDGDEADVGVAEGKYQSKSSVVNASDESEWPKYLSAMQVRLTCYKPIPYHQRRYHTQQPYCHSMQQCQRLHAVDERAPDSELREASLAPL